jgi:hypothetical protein
MDSVEMVIRREGQGTYGLGEVVIPGVTLFRAGADWQNYNLDWDGLQQAIRRQKKATIKQQSASAVPGFRPKKAGR